MFWPAALSLALPLFFGTGALALLALGLGPEPGKGWERNAQFAGTALLLGLLADAAVVCLSGSLVWGALFCALAGALGWLRLGRPRLGIPRWPVVLIGLAAVLYLAKIVATPMEGWDGRSIWFYHAKLLFTDQGFVPTSWTNPADVFSHANYPVLFPILAAQIARMAGFWNEFLPKLGLFWLLAPGLLLLGGLAARRLLFIAAFLILLPAMGFRLWYGSVDGYLALYVSLGFIYAVLWSREGSARDLSAALASLGCALALKDEAKLAVLAVITFFAAAWPWRYKAWRSFLGQLSWGRWMVLSLLCLSELLAWEFRRRGWGLESDLKLGSEEYLARAEGRLGSLLWIAHILARDGRLIAGWTMSGLVVALHWRRFPEAMPEWLGISLAQVVFLGVMLYVYLGTPMEISWHLANSAKRVMLTPFCFMALSFLAAVSTPEKQNG
ncbi:MAG: hypothetical protein V4498_01375 [candidate division FCPU426 bacterium]